MIQASKYGQVDDSAAKLELTKAEEEMIESLKVGLSQTVLPWKRLLLNSSWDGLEASFGWKTEVFPCVI